MARQVVLVNGLPGAGKTTVAAPLAAVLGAPLLAKDALKEALADAVGPEAHGLVGAAAMEAVWRLASAPLPRVVVESWWFRPRDLDHALRGLATAGADAVVEVWCDVPADVARERFDARAPSRHPVHADGRDLAADWGRWAEHGAPLALGPVLRVDTRAPVDVALLAQRVVAALGRDPRRTGAAARRA